MCCVQQALVRSGDSWWNPVVSSQNFLTKFLKPSTARVFFCLFISNPLPMGDRRTIPKPNWRIEYLFLRFFETLVDIGISSNQRRGAVLIAVLFSQYLVEGGMFKFFRLKNLFILLWELGGFGVVSIMDAYNNKSSSQKFLIFFHSLSRECVWNNTNFRWRFSLSVGWLIRFY